MTLIAYTYDIQPGTPEDITQVMANFNSVKAVINGNLDNANLAVGAAIVASKLAGYPNDVSKSLRGDGTWQAAGGVADGYGTSLPGSPSGGDRFVLVDNAANPTYQWLFRYNSGSSSSFKWEYIGGIAKLVEVPNDEGLVGGYSALATPGPSFTVPRAGDYIIRHGFYRGTTAGISGVFGRMSFDVGGTAATDADAAISSTISDGRMSVATATRKNGLAASTAIVCKYKSSSGMDTASFTKRWLEVVPCRVS